jgi:hypothetical protein
MNENWEFWDIWSSIFMFSVPHIYLVVLWVVNVSLFSSTFSFMFYYNLSLLCQSMQLFLSHLKGRRSSCRVSLALILVYRDLLDSWRVEAPQGRGDVRFSGIICSSWELLFKCVKQDREVLLIVTRNTCVSNNIWKFFHIVIDKQWLFQISITLKFPNPVDLFWERWFHISQFLQSLNI